MPPLRLTFGAWAMRAEPGDIVGPVTLFVSPAAGFVTGQVLVVDGRIRASQ